MPAAREVRSECIDRQAVLTKHGDGISTGLAVSTTTDQPAQAVTESLGARPLIVSWTGLDSANDALGISVTASGLIAMFYSALPTLTPTAFLVVNHPFSRAIDKR